MSTISREGLNQKEYLVVRLGEGEYVDEDCIAAVSGGQDAGMEGILPISYVQFEGRMLRYDINAYVPFAEYKKQIRDKESLCRVFLSILDTYHQAESYLLDPACFLLTQEYIFVDKGNGKAWLILYPVYDGAGRPVINNGDFPDLFRNMLRGIRLSEGDMAFYGSLSCELDSEETFNIVAFRRFLAEKGKRKEAGQEKREPVRAEEPKEVQNVVPKPRERADVRMEEPILPFSEPEPAGDHEGKGGWFLGGLLGRKFDKANKAKQPKEPDKGSGKEPKEDTGRRKKHGDRAEGGIRLPDAEELPQGFQENKDRGKPESTGIPGKKKEKRKEENERKRDQETKGAAVSVFEPVAQTDDELFGISPTDDEDFGVSMTRRLYLKQSDSGEIIPVGHFPFVIGREGSGLIIDETKTKVSRLHAVINETEEGFTIRDTSKLGTFLDGERLVKNEDVPLSDGMRVLLKEIAYDVIIEAHMG